MSPLRRFTDACVRATGRRWPEELADTMVREWQAELAHLRERGGSRYRQLAFAVSLVCSPAAGSPVGWRARLPRVGPATMLVLLYAAVALVAVDLNRFVVPQAIGLRLGSGFVAPAAAGVVLALAAAGWLVGRRVAVAGGRRPLLAAVAVALPPVVVMYRYGTLPYDRLWLIGGWRVVGLAVWFLVMTFVLKAARRRAAAGHGVRAMLAGLGGAFVACDLATMVTVWPVAARGGLSAWFGPLWFPLALRGPYAPGFGAPVDFYRFIEPAESRLPVLHLVSPSQMVVQSAVQMLPLMSCALFALLATVRGGRIAAAVATESGPETAPVAGPPTPAWPLVRPVGAIMVAAGALAWASVLHWHGFDWFGVSSALSSNGLFAGIQRGAIVLVGAGTAMLIAGRGPVAVPALAVPLAMLAATRTLHRGHLPGTAAALAGVAVVAVAVGGAWWLSGFARRALPQIPPASPRRALLFVAVLASVMIPGAFGPTTQHTLWLVEYGVAAALGLGAATAALGARAEPPRPWAAAVVLALGLCAALAGGSIEVGRSLYWFSFDFIFQVPLMIVLVLVAAPPGRRRGWLGWAVATAAAVAAMPWTARDLVFGGTVGLALLLAALLCRRAPATAGRAVPDAGAGRDDAALALPA